MFLDDLLQRTLDGISPITPRRASRYEATVEPIEAAAETRAEDIPARIAMAGEPVRIQPTPHQVPPGSPSPLEAPGITPAPEAPPERVVVERQIAPASPAPPARKVAQTGPVPVVERIVERRLNESAAAARFSARGEQAAGQTAEESRIIEDRVESRTIVERFHELERITRHESVTHESRVEAAPREVRPVADSLANRAVRASQPRVVPETRAATPSLPVVAPIRAEPAAPAPVVHVTIGRVEVRASTSARTAPQRVREPKTGLEEYLQRRERA
jgi:hypothetical protein